MIQSVIKKITPIGVRETKHFVIELDKTAAFSFEAGQYVNLRLEPDKTSSGYSFSIASPPQEKSSIELCIRYRENAFMKSLWAKSAGDTVWIDGPYGEFTLQYPLAGKLIFLSTGTGIAPLRSMILKLLTDRAPVKIWNIFGNRFDNDILYQKEFEALASKCSNLHNLFTVSKPQTWEGETGYVQQVFKKEFPNPADTHVYMCGVRAMVESVEKTALELGYSPSQISYEKY